MPSRRRRFRARPKPQVAKPPANDEIRAAEVRLVDVDGGQLGVIPTPQARALAIEKGTDLVVVAAKASPPVVRLMDLGKFMYEKRKKQAKQKTISKSGHIKGVRIGFKTEEHDWQLRLDQAAKFLDAGHKVKLEIRLRGREKSRLAQAEEKIRQFITATPGGAHLEGNLSKSPRGLTAVLTR